MREAIFGDRRQEVANIARDVAVLVREDGVGLDPERKREAEGTIERLIARFSYCRNCAGDVASLLVRKRFHDLVV
jgi:hypothetical protein